MTDAQSIVSILNPDDSLARQNVKLQRIVDVLMQRVESGGSDGFNSYSHFQTAVALEAQVRARTKDLEDALAQLNQSKGRLADAKQEAETAREDLSGALEAVKEGFALFDAEQRLIMTNSRFARMFPDVVVHIAPGLDFHRYIDLISTSSSLVLSDGMTPAAWRAARVLKHNLAHANFIVQLRGDRWIQVSEQRTPNGSTAVLQTEVTDMVRLERQERERLLDDQARIVRATLDHINQGVCIFDAEDRLAGWNNRLHVLMSPPMELMRAGTGFASFVEYFNSSRIFGSEERPQKVVEWVNQRRKSGSLRLELSRLDGIILDVFCEMTPDFGFVISFTDVTSERATTVALHEANETLEHRVVERTTELQQARDAAERANTSKSRFLAAASHDLLQPLNAAKLFISSLEETRLLAGQEIITSRIKSAFDSVETILGALLDISKLDAGTSATISIFPLSRLLRPLEEEFQAIAKAKGLSFSVIDCGLDVESDAAYLRRIIQNLASNAIAYTDSGKVLIGVRRRGTNVEIEIHDTGPGIPADQQERVFHEFHRLTRQKDSSHGMGLGLAIVRRACDLLQHDLKLESTEGYGTKFTVTVPCHMPKTDGHAPAPRRPQSQSADLTDMITLIIENETSVRLGMTMLLDSWGASPIEAANLKQADRVISELGVTPDVILADYHLDEGLNGLQAIKALRIRYGSIPAVLITADHSAELVVRAKADDVVVLNKPLQPLRLRSILSGLKARI
ncbi:PAS-domain containing protein [Pseudogemmobacter sp. W21_MBD1_M6]|uniref:hybrid sensor histidine kinase/response regulator n=1 Tax=Pseudogemmobacter sp. W21_MBD1_M6 TaxID=3240271 RepID=UPI003F9DF491